MKTVLLAAGLSLAAALIPACARADDASERHDVAAQVLEQLHSADMVGAIIPSIIGQIKTNLTHNDPDLVKAFEDDEPQLRAEAEATRPELLAKLVDVYATTFTLDELTNMLAYYKTPVGQRIIAVQGSINHDMLAAARDWGTGLAQRLNAEAAAKLQGTAPAPSAPARP